MVDREAGAGSRSTVSGCWSFRHARVPLVHNQGRRIVGVGKVRGPIAHEAAGRAGRSGRRPLSTLLPTGVGQRGLDDLARMVCLLGRSVPERRAEAVYDGRDPKPAERLAQRLLDEQLVSLARNTSGPSPASATPRVRHVSALAPRSSGVREPALWRLVVGHGVGLAVQRGCSASLPRARRHE